MEPILKTENDFNFNQIFAIRLHSEFCISVFYEYSIDVFHEQIKENIEEQIKEKNNTDAQNDKEK